MNWLFERIEVGEVWGVGRRISAKLNNMGIHTVQDLKHASPRDIRSHFGVVIERTCQELRGISCLALEEISPPRKEIVSSKSFGTMVTTLPELCEAVTTYIARAAEKLRFQKSVCGAINVFVQTNAFREQDPQYNNGLTIPLFAPTDDNRILAHAALRGLEAIYREGFQYKKAGIMLLDLSPNTVVQHSFFEDLESKQKSKKIMEALDSLNNRYGRDTVKLGSAGTTATWSMKAGNKTPCYTTRWDELPVARAN